MEVEMPWLSPMDRQKGHLRKPSGSPDGPVIERRAARRYNMALPLRYILQTAAGQVYIGKGVTRNISSRGLLFRPEEGVIPAGFMRISPSPGRYCAAASLWSCALREKPCVPTKPVSQFRLYGTN